MQAGGLHHTPRVSGGPGGPAARRCPNPATREGSNTARGQRAPGKPSVHPTGRAQECLHAARPLARVRERRLAAVLQARPVQQHEPGGAGAGVHAPDGLRVALLPGQQPGLLGPRVGWVQGPGSAWLCRRTTCLTERTPAGIRAPGGPRCSGRPLPFVPPGALTPCPPFCRQARHVRRALLGRSCALLRAGAAAEREV